MVIDIAIIHDVIASAKDNNYLECSEDVYTILEKHMKNGKYLGIKVALNAAMKDGSAKLQLGD